MTKNLFYGHKAYEWLRWIVQILLPAFATLYFALGSVWSWPNVEQVMATVTAVATFLGLTLGISKINYDRNPNTGSNAEVALNALASGVLNVIKRGDGRSTYDLALHESPLDLADKEKVVFEVKKTTEK